jgi:hypothetical protein
LGEEKLPLPLCVQVTDEAEPPNVPFKLTVDEDAHTVIVSGPAFTIGVAFTETAAVVEEHPFKDSVNVNVTEPGVNPVAIPDVEFTDAISGKFETHVPPVEGRSWIEFPMHKVLPAETFGNEFIVTVNVS